MGNNIRSLSKQCDRAEYYATRKVLCDEEMTVYLLRVRERKRLPCLGSRDRSVMHTAHRPLHTFTAETSPDAYSPSEH